jgi:hypothetical protein
VSTVTRKTEISAVNGTPEKRLFLSIISDYDLRTGICELIDNALDLAVANSTLNTLKIAVTLDSDRQLIQVKDNAGGVHHDQLRLLVAPGASDRKFGRELIGIFGVGGKRAGVALGELVEIKTRSKGSKSVQINIDSEWLATDDWALAAYEIPAIEVGTTIVDISKLRRSFTEDDVEEISTHLSETYSWFIENGCELRLNNIILDGIRFDQWAYPPNFHPSVATFDFYPDGSQKVTAKINAGLILDRDPEKENYGVYFYCNNRLIVKELRTRDVGYFVTSEAGVPHPDASLCRVLVQLNGPAELMPWNSSKSGVNYHHLVFLQIRPRLIDLVKFYSSLSRRFRHTWEHDVFQHTSGTPMVIPGEEMLASRKIVLPPLPRVRKLARIDELKTTNSKVLKDKPWTLGLVEALGLVDVVMKQSLDTRNRAAMILLDSNFEIALKEFIVNRTDLFPPHVYNDSKISTIFKARHQVINEVKAHVTIDPVLLGKVSHYYNLRNKLVHERATVGITDNQIQDYRTTVEKILTKLFGLKFPKG